MTAAEFSLLALTFAFFGLVWWVYTPRRRNRLESYGSIPLEDGERAGPAAERRRS